MHTKKRRIVFCDFDGTITINDNIVALMKHFNPDGWSNIVEDVIHERKSVRQGVGEMFALLPVSLQEQAAQQAIAQAQIRPGFAEFLQYCQEQDIDFYVTSGGIDFFVYPLLEPFGIPTDHIYCNGSDFSGDTIQITWPNACQPPCTNDCGMCKTTIVRQFPAEKYERIVIGDSVTDFAAAKLVETIYARSHLIDKCEQLQLPFTRFETFFDIIEHMSTSAVLDSFESK
ncbi:2-hydroxy-3-keto-5-methylthiopentenyl-1-phosphate phosphatase [Paenibacillus sp. UMB4589-SE434]|uniref:2-hydroxy-3-keto-5-methylthiopentenyl-1- phosphate phosphatase n=1 Tax=Paenibacillus sp. UMB4589-SE434 TaxID=3046314 RepID=UPI0025508AB4|nr:2-hydroxy-3-keto-5-methylthiopentenyl-1-phosphate phosphatase [Paenibacillus sp. UMB4589-SE434]MDK8179684.1 2-hydroxy-3-keto-5-methylthiopentenyl-1-phosphate phosphatase [Paenibacillus sp. UMB4589-SE434]